MRYLLDTNAIIKILAGGNRVEEQLAALSESDFGIPTAVAYELYFGAFKSARIERNLQRIDGLRFVVLDLTREDSRRAGEVRAVLAKAGTPIGPCDTLIAGQCLSRSLTLITHNTREFARVPGLKLEDWEA